MHNWQNASYASITALQLQEFHWVGSSIGCGYHCIYVSAYFQGFHNTLLPNLLTTVLSDSEALRARSQNTCYATGCGLPQQCTPLPDKFIRAYGTILQDLHSSVILWQLILHFHWGVQLKKFKPSDLIVQDKFD